MPVIFHGLRLDPVIFPTFSTIIKEWASAKVHVRYLLQQNSPKRKLSNTYFLMENGKELTKIDGGLLWAATPTDISILWLIQSVCGKIHRSGTDNTWVYPWQSLVTGPVKLNEMLQYVWELRYLIDAHHVSEFTTAVRVCDELNVCIVLASWMHKNSSWESWRSL